MWKVLEDPPLAAGFLAEEDELEEIPVLTGGS